MNIRFHYPAEHMLNGTTYDLEMQIFGNDTYNRALACFSQHSAISVFFKLDDTSTNPFFDWQAEASKGGTVTIDPSLFLTQISGTTATVSGYMGTDSMPPCSYGTCWYLMNEA